MAKKQFVSIGIPVRNGKQTIAKTLKSILKQDLLHQLPLQQKEIIVCDNQSTDRTREVVKELQKAHPEIKLVSSGAKSQTAGINKVIETAKSDIVCLFDSDIVLKRNTVRTLVEFLRNNREFDVASGRVLSSPGASKARLAKAAKLRYPMNVFGRILLKGKTSKPKTTGISGAVFAIRKGAFRPIPANIIRNDFFLILAGLKAAMLKDAIVFHPAKPREQLVDGEYRARIGRMQLEEKFGKKKVRLIERKRYRKQFEPRKLSLTEKLHYPFFRAYVGVKRTLLELKAKRDFQRTKRTMDGSYDSRAVPKQRRRK